MNEQNIQTISVSDLNLRNLLLRRKLNLSKSSWDQLLNSKWHDEIYATRKGDPFKRYKIHQPFIIDKQPFPVCTWKAVIEPPSPQSISTNKDTVISKLESQISDLRTQVFILSLLNFGLVAFHVIK